VSHYPIQNGLADLYKYKNIQHSTQGGPRAPPRGPAEGAPPVGGPPGSRGQSPSHCYPATTALHIRVHNSARPPTHCSRTLSSWIWDHMPSRTPCSTTSNRRRKSSKSSHQLTMAAGTNEVALWAPQPYIFPLPNFHTHLQDVRVYVFLLSSAMGSGSRHLHSHIPRVIIHPRPWGRIFLTSRPGTHAHVQNYQIVVICSLSSHIVHVGYSILMCVGTWSSQTSATPSGI
jgi:hypothetical protein